MFSSVASLSGDEPIDVVVAENLTAAISQKWENFEQKKIFTISEIKTTTKEDKNTLMAYGAAIINVPKKYPIKKGVLEILQEVLNDESGESLNVSELLHVTTQLNKMVGELVAMNVPQSLSTYHLNMVNDLQAIAEITDNLKYFYSDPILAISSLTVMTQSNEKLESSTGEILNLIRKKAGN